MSLFKTTIQDSTMKKYYWSHGACAHNSADCRNKKEGHKDSATVSIKMGGSLDFCCKSE